MRNQLRRDKWKMFLVAGVAALALPILAPAPAHAATYQNVSANWSGYMATGGTYTGVSGTWTVPSVRSSSTYRADAAWVGIGGVSTSDLIQAGTSATTGSGPTTYQAWIEMLPNFAQNVPLNVGSGDSVSVSISEQSSGKWKIAIVNNTSGQSYSTSVKYKSSLSSAEWIEEMPSDGIGLIALDSFSKVNFSSGSAVVNGSRVSIGKTGAQMVAMASSSGTILAVPSALSKSGSAFSVSRAGSGLRAKNARLVRSFSHSKT